MLESNNVGEYQILLCQIEGAIESHVFICTQKFQCRVGCKYNRNLRVRQKMSQECSMVSVLQLGDDVTCL
jgi:hypothetical protein